MNQCEIGLYGLGVMGRGLANNLIRHGFSTAVYSKSEKERQDFSHQLPQGNWEVCASEGAFVDALQRPRVILLMITAGNPVDQVLKDLLPLLDPGDVVIDGGNSYYEDTNRRCSMAGALGIEFLGVGVSGGERGALEGPCMMVGGSKKGWDLCKKYFKEIAAKAQDGKPCCDYIGPDGAGHYVKMVHNGIEYSIMQQIADIYGLMRDGLEMNTRAIGDVFKDWQSGPLSSYLIEIAASILHKQDADGSMIVDHILDVARQKGTGCWSVLEAAKQGVYAPCIDEALFTRYVSEQRNERIRGKSILPCTKIQLPAPNPAQLENTLLAAIICSYAQGVALIAQASDTFKWKIDLASSVRLWRNGCIIRAQLLDKIADVLETGERQLLFSLPEVRKAESHLRSTVLYAVGCGIAVPSVSAALLYYDQYRTAQMSVNMVQALRDCFGAHTYERIDIPGTFHTKWEKETR